MPTGRTERIDVTKPAVDPTISLTSGDYKWVSTGTLGALSHVAIAPKLYDRALCLCGSINDVNEMKQAIEPYRACSKCLEQLRDLTK